MFKKRRNTYHNASKWAHSHTLIVALGIFLLGASLARNIGSILEGEEHKTVSAQMAVCGNGIIEEGEQCDDENLDDGDGCSSTCELEPLSCDRLETNVQTGYAPQEIIVDIIDGIYTGGFRLSQIFRGEGNPGWVESDNSHIYNTPGNYNILVNIGTFGNPSFCELPVQILSPLYCGNETTENYYTGDNIESVSKVDIYAVTGGVMIYNGTTGAFVTLSASITGPHSESEHNWEIQNPFPFPEDGIIISGTGDSEVTIFYPGTSLRNGVIGATITTTGGYEITTQASVVHNRDKLDGLIVSYSSPQVIINGTNVTYGNHVLHTLGGAGQNFENNTTIAIATGALNYDRNNDGMGNLIRSIGMGDYTHNYYINNDHIITNLKYSEVFINSKEKVGRSSQDQLFITNGYLFEEQCDLGDDNGQGLGCTDQCQLEPLTCTLSIDNATGYADRTVFTYDVQTADRATGIYFEYGDGQAGEENTHIYSETGMHTVTAYVTHPYDANEVATCTNEIYIEDQEPGQCQIIIEPGFRLRDYEMGDNEGQKILETLTIQDNSTSVHDIVSYERSIHSSAINQDSYIFDDSIIKSGTGTDTIELDFSAYPEQANRPVIWIALTVEDERGNTATSKNFLNRWHGSDDFTLEHYTLIGDTITDYLIVGSEINIQGTVNASIAINETTTNVNNFMIMDDLGFPAPSQTLIDRENDGNRDEDFVYTQPYTTSHTYDTGSHILVLETRGGGLEDAIAYKHYAVECTECPTDSVTSEDLVIDVYKGLQSESSSFPGGIVPYYVKATNESTQATLQNITIVDIISDNATIISYSFEYNNVLYTVPVNSGAFVIDNNTAQGPIELAPGENIEIIIYAGIEVDGDEATNYIFIAGNWVAPEGVEICELEDSDAQNQCARTNEGPNNVPTMWDNYDLVESYIQSSDFQVCADNDQGASTETATCNTEEGECQLDPDITLEKTLVDNQGNEIDTIVIGEEATFIIDLTFTNLRPHNFNRSNFSLTDYLSGSVNGTQGLDITNISFDGQNIPYTQTNDEYSIDLSNIYETTSYTPMCMTFERDPSDHGGTDWSQFPFVSTSNGGPHTGYQAFLPAEALASGYNRITRYEIEDNGEFLLNLFRYYPGQNDQRLNNTAVRKYFEDYSHTVRVCQPSFQGNGINEFDDISLEVTAIITEAGYIEEELVCNEAHLSYNNEFDLTDDVCFALQCPEGSILENGECVTTTCTDDEDCPDGYLCIDDECVGQCPNGAINRSDCDVCPDGYSLVNGQCIIDICTDANDCPAGYTCIDDECVQDTQCRLTTSIFSMYGSVPHEVEFMINTGLSIDRYIDYGDGFTGTDNPYTYTTSGLHTAELYVNYSENNPTREVCSNIDITVCGSGQQYCFASEQCLDEGESCEDPICGNGLFQPGQQCETNSQGEIIFAPGTPEQLQDEALCNINSCQLDTGCGDGFRDEHGLYGPAEQCDRSDPDAANSAECSLLCTLQICVQNYVAAEATQWTAEQCEDNDSGPSLRWLVIDRSGSMGSSYNGVTRMQDTQAAITGMLAIMQEAEVVGGVLISGDMIGMSSFNQQASLDIGFTGDFAAVADAVIGLVPSGTTNIASGIQIGYNEFLANTTLASGTNQYMIVLSDGQANAPAGSNSGPLAVAEGIIAQNAGIKVYSISVGAPQAQQTMAGIASPGSFYELQSSSMLADLFAGIYQQETCGGTEQIANVLCCELGEEPYSTNNDSIMNECCPEGSSVINGECVPDVCTNGATNPPDCDICPTGSILVDGQCVPSICPNGATNRPNCDTCPTGSTLIDGQCTPLCINGAINPPECDVCPTGFTLIDGQCEPTICTDNEDCPEGFACIDDECVAMVCTNGAINRPDCDICPTGFTLIDGQCEPTVCTDDEDCPEGYECLDGTCIAQCTNGATNPPDCDICPEGYSLVNGQCVIDICRDDADCPDGYLCIGDECVAQCTNGAINPPECDICPEGSTLIDGQCIPDICTDDEDCPEGFVCIGDECVAMVCTNGAINPPECDICPSGQILVNDQCVNTSGGGGPVGGGTAMDYCPDGDFSGSYYDGECGEMLHPTAPIGRFCIYDDEDYLENGPFEDSLGHRGYPYVEIMRISCLHRGRETNQNRWMYQPDGYIQRDEALKTFVKTLGIQFEDFTIETEDQRYPYATPFLDVSQDHRFAHYAQYAKNEGITAHLEITNTDGITLNPWANMTRFEAIKTLIDTYEIIVGYSIEFSGESNMTDVQDSSDRYYSYIRKAEALGFISGFPESDGTYTFRGNNLITRAEFAKIIANAFNEQLLNVEDIVLTSQLYATIAKSIHEVEGNKLLFINELLENMQDLDDVVFINEYKVKKSVFIDILYEKVFIPMAEFYMQQQ